MAEARRSPRHGRWVSSVATELACSTSRPCVGDGNPPRPYHAQSEAGGSEGSVTRKHAVGVAGAAVLVAVALWATVEIGGGSSGAGSGSSPVLARPTSQPFDNAGVCPKATDPVLPADAGCVTAVATDLDGDGATDRFSVFARI